MSSSVRPLTSSLLLVLLTASVSYDAAAQEQERVPITFTAYTKVEARPGHSWCSWQAVGSHADPVGNGKDSDYTYTFDVGSVYFDGKMGNTPSEWTGVSEDIPGERITFASSYATGGAGPDEACDFPDDIFIPDDAYAYYTPPANQPPTACFDFDEGDAPRTVTFDASCSDDSDGQVTGFSWDFGGEGTRSTGGANPSFTYNETGVYTVSLTVEDDDGDRSATVSRQVVARGPNLRYAVSLMERGKGVAEGEDTGAFHVGDTVLVSILIENTGDWRLEEIQLSGGNESVALTSDPDGALEFIRSEKDMISALEPNESDSLLYLYTVNVAADFTVLVDEVTSEAVDPDSGERMTYSESAFTCSSHGKKAVLMTDEMNDPCDNGSAVPGSMLVNSTGDAPRGEDEDGNPLKGCDSGETITREEEEEAECTLRAAIEVANSGSGDQVIIGFSIPAEDAGCADMACTIESGEALPPITRPTIVDGTTQPGYVFGQPRITLSGSGGAGIGLHLASDNIGVKGLAITGFNEAGVKSEGTENFMQASVIGRTSDALAPHEGTVGILLSKATGNLVGGGAKDCADETGNILSGNVEVAIKIADGSSQNNVVCNLIGVHPQDSRTIANGNGIVIENAPSNQVVYNDIAANQAVGVHIVGSESTSNRISSNIIGGIARLGSQGNGWGVVIESASHNIIGESAGSSSMDYNIISGNTMGDVLIFSDDPGAPANNNLVHRNGIGSDHELLMSQHNSAQVGLAISGHASYNQIGYSSGTPGDYSNVIGGHAEADVMIYTPHAVENTVTSALIGVGMEYLVAGEGGPISDFGIDIRAANGTRIGSLSANPDDLPSVVLGNTKFQAIQVEGRQEREVDLEGVRAMVLVDDAGSGTVIQGVRIPVFNSEGVGSAQPNSRKGIGLWRTTDVEIGPQVEIGVCNNTGISLYKSHNNRVVGTRLYLEDHPSCSSFAVTIAGIYMNMSSKNQIGTAESPGSGNRFDGFPVAIEIVGLTDDIDEASVGNRVDGATFGEERANDVGIRLGSGVFDMSIGGSEPGRANHFIRNGTGILLQGNEAGLPLIGSIIEGNTFGTEDGSAENEAAIEVRSAVFTRIGAMYGNDSAGGNVIQGYRRGVVVQSPVEGQNGTIILGNSIFDVKENGIVGWADVKDRFTDLYRFPVAAVATTKSDLFGSGVTAIGSVVGRPDRDYVVQYFRSEGCHGVNEGRDYLMQATLRADANGVARFRQVLDLEDGDGLTVTATDIRASRTGEFSNCYMHGDADEKIEAPLDVADGETLTNSGGIVVNVASVNKTAVADTLYVTAFADPPVGGRFSGGDALSPAGTSMIPKSVVHRHWRIETTGPATGLALDICLDASALPEDEAAESVIVHMSHTTGGVWMPLDTHEETLDGVRHSCVYAVQPSGDFSFSSGIETVVAAPTLVAPADGVIDVLLGSEFSWQPVPGAANYHFQIAVDRFFDALVADTSGIAGTSIIPDSLERGSPYFWRVRAVTGIGEKGPWSASYEFTTGITGVGTDDDGRLPDSFALYGNYPNPFNPQTTIGFNLPTSAAVNLVVYNVRGREVAHLVDETLPAGRHEAVFDAAGLPSGMYFYRLRADSFSETYSMTFIK